MNSSEGHRLTSQSDTELLPHLYEEHGTDLLQQLRGMFGFALWDGGERRLMLARDRVGIKPLYWAQTDDYLIFASEVKAIFASGLVPREIDRDSVDDLFSISYRCAPRTMFRGVFELLPGHFATIRAGQRLETTERYWRAPFPHRGQHRRVSRAQAEVELRELLTEKVKEHLDSDVPVATYLSGGLDSSLITALVKEVQGEAPQTFSIGFSENEFE